MDQDLDWRTVGRTVTARMKELGLRQRDVADKADVGLSTVQELANGKVRERNPKTLMAISNALEWPSGKIAAIARGKPGEVESTLEERVAALETELAEVVRRLDRR
ncbi:helix-turn-helix domain-containing protein [Saccharopolyspora sp. HNM0983]|uniref:Helix-turn-helix domain-containing protein n=1 Tax=Saccharopolyspora montiporae TaxID=2781240 RepID=A0A929B987_9PSEU|nr:helix-turn-helix domain-containing protein [Saccharopolyspora sp. HNM0983]MBE9375589.1 helix-turn-helix domain-containing protein [Saccharopolyspora sp. HNM0983]